MAQPARRRRTQPVMASAAPPEPPDDPPAIDDDNHVTCFLSGERVPKERAVLVRIGPGRTMWMSKDLTSQG